MLHDLPLLEYIFIASFPQPLRLCLKEFLLLEGHRSRMKPTSRPKLRVLVRNRKTGKNDSSISSDSINPLDVALGFHLLKIVRSVSYVYLFGLIDVTAAQLRPPP